MISEHHFYYLDAWKHSAKGITKVTQRLLTHEKYIEALASGNILRDANTRVIYKRHVFEIFRAKKVALSAYDDKLYILSDGISTLPYGHYRIMKASIFPDNTDSNQHDNVVNDDSERNVSETNSTIHYEDENIDACLRFFEEKDEIVDWDPENSNQEEIFKQVLKCGSQDSFLVMNTQPSWSLRDLLNRVSSYEAPDPGRIRVTEIAESNIESDDLVDANAVTSSSPSDDERYLDREAVEDSATQSRDAKQTKNSKVQVKYKI